MFNRKTIFTFFTMVSLFPFNYTIFTNAGYFYICRNLFSSLKESGSEDYVVDKLIEKLSDENSDVQGKAVEALGSIGKSSDEVIKALSSTLNDKELYVRTNAFKSLELLAGGEYF